MTDLKEAVARVADEVIRDHRIFDFGWGESPEGLRVVMIERFSALLSPKAGDDVVERKWFVREPQHDLENAYAVVKYPGDEIVRDLTKFEAERVVQEHNAPLLRQPEAAPGWQKIETAPKDGRGEQIIAFIPWSNQTDDNDRGYVATVYWDPGYEGAPDSPAYEATWVTFAGCNHVKPTHWMPLPPAPSASSVDSGVSE